MYDLRGVFSYLYITYFICPSVRIYLYFNFITKIVVANIKVTPLAIMIGKFESIIPYTSQNKTPIVKVRYMVKDRSFVCLVFITFMACGKNEMVVHIAAINPIMVTESILSIVLKCITNIYLWSFNLCSGKDVNRIYFYAEIDFYPVGCLSKGLNCN